MPTKANEGSGWHQPIADDRPATPSSYRADCPVRVWLEKPLGERAVIDVDSDQELPLFTPDWFDGVRQPDAGYRPANRRRRRGLPSERHRSSA